MYGYLCGWPFRSIQAAAFPSALRRQLGVKTRATSQDVTTVANAFARQLAAAAVLAECAVSCAHRGRKKARVTRRLVQRHTEGFSRFRVVQEGPRKVRRVSQRIQEVGGPRKVRRESGWSPFGLRLLKRFGQILQAKDGGEGGRRPDPCLSVLDDAGAVPRIFARMNTFDTGLNEAGGHDVPDMCPAIVSPWVFARNACPELSEESLESEESEESEESAESEEGDEE